MQQSREISFDVASVLGTGRREHQEDALASDFPLGAGCGYAVLADGMGGHAAGDVASKIVVTEVFSELKLQSGDMDALLDDAHAVLGEAAMVANSCVKAHTDTNPDAKGMGSTLIATVFNQDRMHWISIGDSPLFIFRDGDLTQLNEDHSLAPQIDYMVRSGLMDPEVGRTHPDRNCLTSVLIGGDIERIDCPEDAYEIKDGDTLVLASDGLQFLTDAQIEDILGLTQNDPSSATARTLLETLTKLDDPDQDNVSFTVIKCAFRSTCAADYSVAWDENAGEDEAIGLAANSAPEENEQPLTFRSSAARNG